MEPGYTVNIETRKLTAVVGIFVAVYCQRSWGTSYFDDVAGPGDLHFSCVGSEERLLD